MDHIFRRNCLATTALVLAISGCGGGGSSSDSNLPAETNNPTANSAAIEGSWLSSCTYEEEYEQYSRNTITFSANQTFTIESDWWDQPGCEGAAVESYQSDNGSFDIGAEIRPGVFELNATSDSDGTDFNIFEIKNQVLYFGIGESNTEAGRPTEIDYDFGLVSVTPTEENSNVKEAILGTWTSECTYDDENSIYLILDMTFNSDNSFRVDGKGWANTACQGAPVVSDTFLTGTYLLGEEVRAGVYEIDYLSDGEPPLYEVIEVNGDILYGGKSAATVASYRPTEIDYSSPLHRN